MPVLRRAAVPLLIWVAGATYCWWRIPVGARNRIWAEDGVIFLQGSLDGAPVWQSYDGYLHVVPRLVTDLIAAMVPVGWWDVALTLAAVGLVGLVGALTWLLTEDVIEHRWVRGLVALAPALLPGGAAEVLGNLANLHGFGLWLAFWLVLHRPASRAAALAWAVAGLLVGLTEVVVVLLAPLMVVGWRDRLRWLPRAGLLLGALAQIVTTVQHPRPPRGDIDWSLPGLVVGFAGQSGSALWADTVEPAARIVDEVGPAGAFLLLLPAAVSLALVLRRGSGIQRTAAVGLVLLAGLVWSASLAANAYPMTFAGWSGDDWRAGGLLRYAASSGLFLFAVPLLALDLARTRAHHLVSAAVVLVVLTVAVLAARPALVVRDQGPAWPTTAEFSTLCAAADRSVVVQVAPDLSNWRVRVPCDRVDR
ncbi:MULTISPECIES: hypothetical protein [unclassified Nocardioides]|uniref:hypothetical protein n=1 Tax=unclassified Nocardioides TaxID=2615069 RepID=UPI00114F073E|nr:MULTISPECIES: hypothetical protein [unclassified Nocardioides]TQK71859.1 hypothetical protein FBY23_3664 [Nocardioides sp. SLBN-35]WGY03945.1 hypothetical protein QI633_09275 [Nocardioides sp. QY071]